MIALTSLVLIGLSPRCRPPIRELIACLQLVNLQFCIWPMSLQCEQICFGRSARVARTFYLAGARLNVVLLSAVVCCLVLTCSCFVLQDLTGLVRLTIVWPRTE